MFWSADCVPNGVGNLKPCFHRSRVGIFSWPSLGMVFIITSRINFSIQTFANMLSIRCVCLSADQYPLPQDIFQWLIILKNDVSMQSCTSNPVSAYSLVICFLYYSGEKKKKKTFFQSKFCLNSACMLSDLMMYEHFQEAGWVLWIGWNPRTMLQENPVRSIRQS